MRARIIVYNKAEVKPALVQNYEDLARPEPKGKVCTRSGAHPYMLSLIGAVWPNRSSYGTHVNVSGPAWRSTRRIAPTPCASSSIWRATKRSAISSTRTTSGRWERR